MTDAIKELINNINESLIDYGAPHITESNDSIKKSETYVQLNNWLRTASDDTLKNIINEYGLVIIAIVLSGVDLNHIAILQTSKQIKYSGYVRYIDLALKQASHKKISRLRTISSLFLSDTKKMTAPELRSVVTAKIIEKYINYENTEKALDDFNSVFK